VKKKTQFAFIRQLQKGSGANLKTLSDIKSAERHANRLDNTSALRQRKGASHADNYFWSNIGEGLEAGGADYVAAYKAHKLRHGVKSERKGAALASHALVGVSPEWLEETGSPHDLNNPRVQALIEASKAWVETWSGEGMVWGVRYDVDEVGSGVVDVLASPVHVQFHKSGSSSPKISINKANDKLLSQVNERLKKEWVTGGQKSEDYKPVRKSFRAMQYSWAWYAQEHLSPELQRGIYIETTRRQHLFPEEYKEALAAQEKYDALKKVAQKDVEELTRGQRRLERREQELEAERRQWDNTLQQRKAVSAELEQKMAELGSVQRLLDKAKDELSNAREQGDMILSNAKRQADEITKLQRVGQSLKIYLNPSLK